MSAYRRIQLRPRPKGTPTSSNFRLEEGPIPVAEKGQVLVRTLYLSLDPYMRGQMNVATPHPIEIGATMDGEAVAEIVQSSTPGLSSWRPGSGNEWLADACGCRGERPAACRSRANTGDDRARGARNARLRGLRRDEVDRPAKGGGDRGGGRRERPSRFTGGTARPIGRSAGRGLSEAPRSAPMSATSWALTPSSTAALGDFRGRWREPAGMELTFTSRAWADLCGRRCCRCSTATRGCRSAGSSPFTTAFHDRVRGMPPAAMTTIVKRSLLVQGYINTEFVADHYADFLREVGALVASGRVRYREDIVEGLEAAPEALIECRPAETSESCWFVLGEVRRAQVFLVLAIRSYSATIGSCLAVWTAGPLS